MLSGQCESPDNMILHPSLLTNYIHHYTPTKLQFTKTIEAILSVVYYYGLWNVGSCE